MNDSASRVAEYYRSQINQAQSGGVAEAVKIQLRNSKAAYLRDMISSGKVTIQAMNELSANGQVNDEEKKMLISEEKTLQQQVDMLEKGSGVSSHDREKALKHVLASRNAFTEVFLK